MQTVSNIQREIVKLEETLLQVDLDIADKKEEVEKLKIDNAKLVEANLGKQRQPKSLELQRNRIFNANQ